MKKVPATHAAPIPSRLTLAALGIVFGDIGTSPLYTFKTVLALTGESQGPAVILGSLSLIVWTLIIVTTIKYINIAMRIDNDGEGGIVALMSLLGVKLKKRPWVVTLGLMGAALIYGDGAITPAISVLSAVEGLAIATPRFEPYVLPISISILLLLFAFQPKGTERIGRAFGPIMAVWFVVIGALGLWGIAQHPAVWVAINPWVGLRFLFSNGQTGFLVLGGVFLCVTGAEALYADMGHFGAAPIRRAWSWLVFPSLVANYAGQAALVLEGAPTGDNIFYRLCPPALLLPLVVLSTIATIIASQAIITGAFSMTRQAIGLGFLPRLQITQTSEKGYGQIYVGCVNWLLMVATIGIILGFQKSDNLAAAYGIAVSATMLATSFLIFIAMREIWHWNAVKAFAIAGSLMVIDAGFFTANLSKISQGGYVPILFAILVYGVMMIWHRGAQVVSAGFKAETLPIAAYMVQIQAQGVVRTKGASVFLTRTDTDTPPVMRWHVKQNHVLSEQLFIIKVHTRAKPWIKEHERMTVSEITPNVWRAEANYGFMEHPDIPALLAAPLLRGCAIDLSNVTYYVGYETVIPREDGGHCMPRWMVRFFAFMQRNSLHVSDYFNLPCDKVVEIGRRIGI